MQIRKFYAKSVPSAMRDIRNLLGADAVIVSTRHLTTEDEAIVINGAPAVVEVTAAVDYDDAQPALEPAASPQAVRRLSGRRPLSRSSLRAASDVPAQTPAAAPRSDSSASAALTARSASFTPAARSASAAPSAFSTPFAPSARPARQPGGADDRAQPQRSAAPATAPSLRADDSQRPAASSSRPLLPASHTPLAWVDDAQAPAAPVRQAGLRGILAELKSLQSTLDRPARSASPGARGAWGSADESTTAQRGPLDHLVGQPRRSPLGRAAAELLNSRLRNDGTPSTTAAGRPWPTGLDAYSPRVEASPAKPLPIAAAPAPTVASARPAAPRAAVSVAPSLASTKVAGPASPRASVLATPSAATTGFAEIPAPRAFGAASAPAEPLALPPTYSSSRSMPVATPPAADGLPLPAMRFRDHLVNQGVTEAIAQAISGAMHFPAGPSSREDLRGTFRHFVDVVATQLGQGLAQRHMALVLSGDRPTQGPRKLALVGPTGVGKTTTIAKIASYYALERNWNVALVTLDTYRVGAVEQLRIYARLLGVPLEVVNDFGELSSALERLSDADLVLIDTPGHGPGDEPALGRLAAALGRQEALEVMLVVAATLRRDEMRRVMRCFRPLGYGRLIFSKLDEAGRLGEVLNTWNESGFEVSYFTAGQRVPEDLEPASAETLCRRLLARPN